MSSAATRGRRLPDSALALLLAIVYIAAAKLGLMMDAVGGFATLVWPATGIAFAALLRGGPQLWPGVAIGAFVVNVWIGGPVAVSLGIAVGNTLEAVLAVWAVRRLTGLRAAPDRLAGVAGLVLFAATLSTMVSATIGTLSLRVGGIITPGHVLETWRAWWLGDAAGDLIAAPILLAWSVRPNRPPPERIGLGHMVELAALSASILVTTFVVFDTRSAADYAFTQIYLLFPLLLWAALRFGLRGATTAAFAISAIAIWSTAHGHGPFVHARLATSLTFLQVFLAIVSITALVLAAAIAERDDAVRARDRLLASVSHELKNPLHTILLGTEVLLTQPRADEQAHRQLLGMRRATSRMGALVRDLLDVAAIEAGRFSLERAPVGARAIVEETLEQAGTLAASRSQTLLRELGSAEVYVNCDRGRVLQVLVNLVDNALKFSPSGGSVMLRVDADGDWVRFSVSDHGSGVAAADARHLFEPYWRARDARSGGTGLGLSIAKAIVEAHGGRIWLERRDGDGSTFCFSLPIHEPADRAVRRVPPVVAPGH